MSGGAQFSSTYMVAITFLLAVWLLADYGLASLVQCTYRHIEMLTGLASSTTVLLTL